MITLSVCYEISVFYMVYMYIFYYEPYKLTYSTSMVLKKNISTEAMRKWY